MQVSVIIPVYNRVDLLSDTIASVLAQTHPAWNLWVVDDGSSEDVQGFMARYRDDRINCVRQQNQGNAVARNTGIRQGIGEYVACLDSDDIWHQDFLKTCLEHLMTHPGADVCFTQWQTIGADGQLLSRPVGPLPRRGDLLADILMGYPILPSSTLIRRRCFDHWGQFAPGMDDWEMWLRWAASGCRFDFIEIPLLNYRIHDQNFSLAYNRRHAVHFAMLDKFYNQKDLPEMALRLRERAYANQHFLFAVLAWQLGRPVEGAAEFVAAVLRYPVYLTDLDFYTRIACAHQGRIDAGAAAGLSLSMAEASLIQCLAALFARPDLSEDILTRQDEAYGWAYLALARLAYGVAHDMAQARRWLWQASRILPALAWRSDWAAWLLRSGLGYNRLQSAKKLLRSGLNHA